MSLVARPLDTSPQMPSAASILPESPGEPWALAPSGSQKAHGQSQVSIGWHKRGGQEGKGERENTSLEWAADRAGFSAWAPSPTFSGFLSSCHRPPDLTAPSPVYILWPAT